MLEPSNTPFMNDVISANVAALTRGSQARKAQYQAKIQAAALGRRKAQPERDRLAYAKMCLYYALRRDTLTSQARHQNELAIALKGVIVKGHEMMEKLEALGQGKEP